MMRCEDDSEASRNLHGIYLCLAMCKLDAFRRSLRTRNTEEERVSSYRAITLAEQTRERIYSRTSYTRSVVRSWTESMVRIVRATRTRE